MSRTCVSKEEDKSVVLPITYFTSIHVPLGNDKYNSYTLTDFLKYYETNLDPFKVYPYLTFMLARMNRLTKLPASLLEIPTVTSQMRNDTLISFVKKWRNPVYVPEEISDSILVDIDTFTGYIFAGCTSEEAESILLERLVGSFLIRSSSMSFKDGKSDATIFALSFKAINRVFHIRMFCIHGVGVYFASRTPDHVENDVVIHGLTRELIEALETNLQRALEILKYASPKHACVIDMLEWCHIKNYIRLDLLIVPSTFVLQDRGHPTHTFC